MALNQLGIQYFEAAPTNFTRGRGGRTIKYITVHHMASQPSTLRFLWGDPVRNGSSHFGVFPDKIEQYVPLEDTSWCNGNWISNQESISIENWGDWRFGFTNESVLQNLKRLFVELRALYPNAQLTFHQDVADKWTECPGELRSHATRMWQEAAPQAAPVLPKIKYSPVSKRVVASRVANLWNLNFNKWPEATAVGDPYQVGHVVDVKAIATHPLGGQYYLTKYSLGTSDPATIDRPDFKPVRNNGFNVKDFDDFVAPPVVTPPVVVPPVVTPPVVTPPVVTPPTPEPTDYDELQDQKINKMEAFINALIEFISKVFSGDIIKDLIGKWRS